ncbi:hypothetical protein ACJX0J_032590, partial [Zea mays]
NEYRMHRSTRKQDTCLMYITLLLNYITKKNYIITFTGILIYTQNSDIFLKALQQLHRKYIFLDNTIAKLLIKLYFINGLFLITNKSILHFNKIISNFYKTFLLAKLT